MSADLRHNQELRTHYTKHRHTGCLLVMSLFFYIAIFTNIILHTVFIHIEHRNNIRAHNASDPSMSELNSEITYLLILFISMWDIRHNVSSPPMTVLSNHLSFTDSQTNVREFCCYWFFSRTTSITFSCWRPSRHFWDRILWPS